MSALHVFLYRQPVLPGGVRYALNASPASTFHPWVRLVIRSLHLIQMQLEINALSLQHVVLPTWAFHAIYLITLSHSLLSLFQTSPYVPLLTSCLLPWLSGDDPASSLAEKSTASRQKLSQFLTYHLPLSPLSLLPVAASFLTSFPPLSEERIFLLLFHVNSSIYLLPPQKKFLCHFLSCF